MKHASNTDALALDATTLETPRKVQTCKKSRFSVPEFMFYDVTYKPEHFVISGTGESKNIFLCLKKLLSQEVLAIRGQPFNSWGGGGVGGG